MAKKLSEKALEFCQEYSKNGYHGTNAYQTVYGQKDKRLAGIGACNLLKDQRVKDELNSIEGDFRNIGFNQGLNKAEMIKVLKEMTQATKKVTTKDETGKSIIEEQPDWTTRFNGVMGFAKLTGDLVEKKKIENSIPDGEEEGEIDLSKLSGEELKAAREKILNSMTIVSSKL